MPKKNITPLDITPPVSLSAKLLETIGDRIETIAPIENSNADSPVWVLYDKALGANIKGNMVAKEATVCIDGSPVRVTLYCKPES